MESCVKNSNMHYDWFKCIDGLREGDGLSPILFALNINDLSKKLSEVDSDRNMSILLYADDLVILAESREMLQKKLDVLYTYCRDNNLKVNINKSNVIAFNSRKDIELLLYNGCILHQVDKLKYLGMTFKIYNITLTL